MPQVMYVPLCERRHEAGCARLFRTFAETVASRRERRCGDAPVPRHPARVARAGMHLLYLRGSSAGNMWR